MFGRSFGCEAKYDLFYAVIPAHTFPIASIITVIVIDTTTHNWVQSSRNEIHSCQLSAISKYSYNNSDLSIISCPICPISSHYLLFFLAPILLPTGVRQPPGVTQGLIEFPMVQLRAEGAIGENPINHRRGPLARPKWPARWPKIW